VALLYPQVLGSLFVASYYSQGYGGGIRPRLHTGEMIIEYIVARFKHLVRTSQKAPMMTVAVTPSTTVSTRQRNSGSHCLLVIKQQQNHRRFQTLRGHRIPLLCLHSDSCWFLAGLTLQAWRCRRHFLRDVSWHSSEYTSLYPRWLSSSCLTLAEPQILQTIVWYYLCNWSVGVSVPEVGFLLFESSAGICCVELYCNKMGIIHISHRRFVSYVQC
jgi:hypothetical protein